eukprot:3341517-Pyramimonas_sp.AAC.1
MGAGADAAGAAALPQPARPGGALLLRVQPGADRAPPGGGRAAQLCRRGGHPGLRPRVPLRADGPAGGEPGQVRPASRTANKHVLQELIGRLHLLTSRKSAHSFTCNPY